MKKLLLASALMVATTGANADVYLKGSVGAFDTGIKDALGGFDGVKASEPTGYSIGLGYIINPYLSVEGEYAWTGDAKASYSDPYVDLDVKGDISAVQLGGVLHTDKNAPFYAGVRAGMFQYKASATVNWLDYYGRGSESDSDSDSDVFYGVIGGYNVTEAVALTFEHTAYKSEGDTSTFTAAGIAFKF